MLSSLTVKFVNEIIITVDQYGMDFADLTDFGRASVRYLALAWSRASTEWG